jgi:hypothetical protein
MPRRGRTHSGKKHHSRKHRGGSSGWGFVGKTVGGMDTQWNNVFEKGGAFGNTIQSVDGTQPTSVAMNNALSGKTDISLIQKAGKRHRKSSHSVKKSRTKKGGYWGQVLSTAAVPFGLFAIQNKFTRRSKHGKSQKRH